MAGYLLDSPVCVYIYQLYINIYQIYTYTHTWANIYTWKYKLSILTETICIFRKTKMLEWLKSERREDEFVERLVTLESCYQAIWLEKQNGTWHHQEAKMLWYQQLVILLLETHCHLLQGSRCPALTHCHYLPFWQLTPSPAAAVNRNSGSALWECWSIAVTTAAAGSRTLEASLASNL